MKLNRILIFSLAGLSLWAAALSGETFSPDYDTDSYIYFRSNNQYDTFISVNPHSEEHAHFNFGMVRFPSEGLESGGETRLSVNISYFVEGGFDTGFDFSDTGMATVHVVALAAPIEDYYSGNEPSGAWYREHVKAQPVVGTFHFASVDGDGLGRYEIDVSQVVDSWVANPETNYGFGFWAESGAVDISSSEGAVLSGEDVAPLLIQEASVSAFQAWRNSRWEGDAATNPAISGPMADPDQDGVTNLEEFVFGLDPVDGLSVVPMAQLGWEGTEENAVVTLTYAFAVATSTLTVSVESKKALDGDWEPLINGENGVSVTQGEQAITVRVPDQRECFFRLNLGLEE